jgi:SMI1 / KNR4 family (SUKH-1)
MTPEEIGRIEHALGVKLPAAYRDAMTVYPFPEQSPAAELWVLNHVGQLLELNAAHRRAGEGRWDPHLVLIGTDGGEETFVLDTARAPYPVLIHEMETGRLKPCAADFSSFIQMQREELERIEADERALAEAYRTKRWWQFWLRPPQGRRRPPDGDTA